MQSLSTIDRSLFVDLVRAQTSGSPDEMRQAALRAARAWREEGDRANAEEVEGLVEIKAGSERPIGLYELKPKKTLRDLNLNSDVWASVQDFLTEQRNVDVLAKHKLDPRHKALFIGPPGNGKTVLAGAISIELNVRSYMVRYDDLISNKPGETSRNLLQIFTFARQEPTLLFFDEFDALGRERDDAQETGEMKRVTSTLLVQIDDLPPHVVAIAATNHGQMLDAAIWRRFNIRLELPKPGLDLFAPFMREMFAVYNQHPGEINGIDLETVALRMVPENFSDAELYVRNCVRTFVISNNEGRVITIEKAMLDELNKWTSGQKKVIG
jgi:ATP-dependent 26S proteasome regulatory subunit